MSATEVEAEAAFMLNALRNISILSPEEIEELVSLHKVKVRLSEMRLDEQGLPYGPVLSLLPEGLNRYDTNNRQIRTAATWVVYDLRPGDPHISTYATESNAVQDYHRRVVTCGDDKTPLY